MSEQKVVELANKWILPTWPWGQDGHRAALSHVCPSKQSALHGRELRKCRKFKGKRFEIDIHKPHPTANCSASQDFTDQSWSSSFQAGEGAGQDSHSTTSQQGQQVKGSLQTIMSCSQEGQPGALELKHSCSVRMPKTG